jgi:hypothetical protein
LQGYGALGHSRAIPVRPWLWKLKEDPLQYLWKRGYDDGANSQNVHLARAAIASFEAAIWTELQQVERALYTELTHLDARVINVVYRLAMEQAQLGIIVLRYNSRQLIEQ